MAQATRIAFLLDQTGSMEGRKSQTISAFNEYLGQLQKDGNDYVFSLVLFSSINTESRYSSVPIGDVKSLDDETYLPNGGTPLIDAAMTLITSVDKIAATGEKVIIAIQTDGEENASREFTIAQLQDIIKEKTEAGWQFVFMGANLDAYAMSKTFGVSAGQTVSYGDGFRETSAVFRSFAQNTGLYASGGAATMDWSAEQRAEAGDQYFQPEVAQPAAAEQPEDEKVIEAKSMSQVRRHEAMGRKAKLVDDMKI